ncbi:MAG: hypothetical protein AB7K24_33265 [Gemmataceae bacterium]
MKATLTDKVFGKLEWDEDSETYCGTVKFPPDPAVEFVLVVNNADETSASELKAFLSAARQHFEKLRQDDSAYRKRAALVVSKALKKEGKGVAEQLRLQKIQIDNAGITMLYYDTCGLLPVKQRYVGIALDMSGTIHLARVMRNPE